MAINAENSGRDSDASSTISSKADSTSAAGDYGSANGESSSVYRCKKPEMTLLDLYSGCGAMSTGLCLGASLSGLKLTTVSHQAVLKLLDLHTCSCEC